MKAPCPKAGLEPNILYLFGSGAGPAPSPSRTGIGPASRDTGGPLLSAMVLSVAISCAVQGQYSSVSCERDTTSGDTRCKFFPPRSHAGLWRSATRWTVSRRSPSRDMVPLSHRPPFRSPIAPHLIEDMALSQSQLYGDTAAHSLDWRRGAFATTAV